MKINNLINLYDKFGAYLIYPEDAKRLYIGIKSSIIMKNIFKEIVLDFNSITLVSSEFFFEFLGKLLMDYDKDEIKSILIPINAKERIMDSYNFTIEHYHNYFRDEEYKKTIDSFFRKNKDNKKKNKKELTIPNENTNESTLTLCGF